MVRVRVSHTPAWKACSDAGNTALPLECQCGVSRTLWSPRLYQPGFPSWTSRRISSYPDLFALALLAYSSMNFYLIKDLPKPNTINFMFIDRKRPTHTYTRDI